MPACLRLALAHPWPAVAPPAPPPPPRLGRPLPARARVPFHRLISTDDYPADALQAEQEGSVDFRLDVDRKGRVTACTILSSSGSASLDSAACSLMTRRAVFEPARDSRGRRTDDKVRGRIVWRLEDPPPPPP